MSSPPHDPLGSAKGQADIPEVEERPPSPPLRITGVVNRPPDSDYLASGGTSFVLTLPDRPDVLLKVPRPFEHYERMHQTERRIYERLGTHPNIVKVLGMDEYGIYLERAEPGCLRLFYKDGGRATTTVRERMVWCRDVALAEQYLHDHDVRHADLSGRNLLLDSSRNILLCDFAGSYIDGEKARVFGEGGYLHPDEEEHSEPTIRSELHCLGSTMYEIITGTQPHGPLDGETAEKLMREGVYPGLDGVPLGDVISRCWKGGFASAGDVALAAGEGMEGRINSGRR